MGSAATTDWRSSLRKPLQDAELALVRVAVRAVMANKALGFRPLGRLHRHWVKPQVLGCGSLPAMDASGSQSANRSYYDAFSSNYERVRGRNAPRGYHELLDTLEAELVQRYGRHRRVLEVGCGTGLVLERIARFASDAQGIDLSPGMLDKARARGLKVFEGSATELPFDSNSFDVTCSFKVLAHVPDISRALSEMTRVTRPGGHVLAEFYNPHSFRGLIKRFGPSGAIARGTDEDDVFTQYHTMDEAIQLAPPNTRFVDARGVRIVTPVGSLLRFPLIREAFWKAEQTACDGWLKRFAGFFVAVYQKQMP